MFFKKNCKLWLYRKSLNCLNMKNIRDYMESDTNCVLWVNSEPLKIMVIQEKSETSEREKYV